MTSHRPTALVLVLALLAGTGALVPSAAWAMTHGEAAEAPRSCCHGKADPCEMPCPSDDGRSLAEAAACCAAGHDAPHDVAVAPPLPVRLDAPVALAAAWLVAPLAPPAPPRPDATRHGPPQLPVRSHLAVSVLLI